MRLSVLVASLLSSIVTTDGLNACFTEEKCAPGTSSVALKSCGLTDEDIPDLAACFDSLGRNTTTKVIVDDNGLEDLPVDLFQGFEALESLYISDNRLSTLPVGVFDGLSSLETLILKDNMMSALPAGLFDGLESLRELSPSNNNINAMPAGIFDDLVNMSNLRISGNNLTTLPAGLFDKFESLEYLYIDNNHLTSLPANIFDGMASLQILSLFNNDLSTLPAGVLHDLEAVYLLFLSGNNFVTLPVDIFDGMGTLKTLYLSENALMSTLPAGLFDELLNLEQLLISDNPALQCLPDTVAQSVSFLTFVGDGICDCPEYPTCDEDGNPCECQPGEDGFSCAPESSSTELIRAFMCSPSAVVEARQKTTVTAEGSGFDERTTRKGCRPDGCTPEKTRDNRRKPKSRWSCKGDLVEGNGGCCIEYHFDDPLDVVTMNIAFYKGAKNTRTLNVYENDVLHSQISSSGSTNGYQEFGLNTVDSSDIKLCLDDYENHAYQWLSITEVQFMVLE